MWQLLDILSCVLRWVIKIGGILRVRGLRVSWVEESIEEEYLLYLTIRNIFLIWISRSFKKVASDNTISYFDQSFRFSGLWLILARDLGRSGQNKSLGTEREQIFFLKQKFNSDNAIVIEPKGFIVQTLLKSTWVI